MAGPQTSNPSKEIDKPAATNQQQDQEGSGFRKIQKQVIAAKL
jgi:hypothetical protein